MFFELKVTTTSPSQNLLYDIYMYRKSLHNQLELGYAPLTAFEFATLKNDKYIEMALDKASLYIVAQRPVITFENLIGDIENHQLIFEIHQKGNSTVLKGKFPLIQQAIGLTEQDEISVAFNFLNKMNEQKVFPLDNIHGFSILKTEGDIDEFLFWVSPEKLIHNWLKGQIDCAIDGDFKAFLKYKVHYVGKATKQSILKRLTGHSTFQDILSLVSPVTELQLPANEIVILPFEFKDNIQIQTIGVELDKESISKLLFGKSLPDQEKIFLDAEKALIKAIKPKYNKRLFKKYPVSNDGLSNDNYDTISYTFVDPITLYYEQGEIIGGLTPIGGDTILIHNNSEFNLVKHK